MPNSNLNEAGSGTTPGNRIEPRPTPGGPVPVAKPIRLGVWIFLIVAVLAAGGWWWARRQHPAQAEGGKPTGGRAGLSNAPVPVIAGTVEKKDVPIYLDGIGTVQAFNSVTVRSRIDGQIDRIAFVEGQDVHAGDLLAQIDPAPLKAMLEQNVAKKAQDEAQLDVARVTLKRDAELLANRILAQQDYDTQQALVHQLAATVQADQAAIDNAKVQLAYTTITSPLDGRTGIRLVDQGNLVHANDANGIVMVTQLRPISVVFTLPEQNLGQIQQHRVETAALSVSALERNNRTPLGEGKLAVIDNQIDTTTGTIRLKATFPNEDLKLWPGQFVNARLLLTVRKGGTVVPSSAIQNGPDGPFAYVITPELTAQVRRVKVGLTQQEQSLIDEGLAPGEKVVVDGQYKLRPGAKVKFGEPGEGGPPRNSPRQGAPKAPS